MNSTPKAQKRRAPIESTARVILRPGPDPGPDLGPGLGPVSAAPSYDWLYPDLSRPYQAPGLDLVSPDRRQ